MVCIFVLSLKIYKTMYQAQKQVTVEFTVQECAKAFCEMNNFEQAEFFNLIAVEVNKWKAPFEFQVADIERTKNLTYDAKTIIEKLYEGLIL